MSGSLIALVSALCFAASNICTRRGVLRVRDASLGVYISVFMAPPLFLLVALLWGQLYSIAAFTWLGYLWMALAGVVHFVGGRSFNYLAIKHLGANMATIFSGLNLVYTILLGIFVLSEKVTQGMVLGALFIIVGPMLLAWTGQRGNRGQKAEKSGKPQLSRAGILAALASGIFFGTSPLLIKWGLQQGGSPVAGAFISYVSATFVLGAMMGNMERRNGILHMERQAIIWFALAGLFVGSAQLLRYTALNLIPVSIASPLISTSPLFLLALSFIVNRKTESFRITTILGAILVVAGTVLMFR